MEMRKYVVTLALAVVCTLLGGTAAAQTSTPAGAVPKGLPARMLVGLFEEWGANWMQTSGVPWDARYAYLVKGWANNWGWGAHDGSMALTFFQECDAGRFIPAVQFYQMNGEPGGGEDAFYAKTKTASTMASYFADFKLLMQRAKDFGKPVIVMVEGDGYGFMQLQSNNNPSAYSAIAASGMPELATLPNSAAGWGLAFLQIRKAVGASNVVLGMHVSTWASGKDLTHWSVTDALQPEVDKVYNFLAPLGLASNVTGATYDFVVSDPLDRDADFYRLTQSQDRWWDASDGAPISSKSFNRYAEWLRLWNVKSKQRWLLWQIPLGNSNHLNVYNGGAPRQGYKDNRSEYFFGTGGRAHLEKFAASGVFGLLFGAGAGGQSSFQNDTYTDGQLFMKSRAGSFLSAGGLPIVAGTTTQPPSPPPPSGAYDFESDSQGFVRSGAPIAALSRSTAQRHSGTSSLAVQVSGSGTATASVANPTARAGATVTFRVFIPTGARIAWMQPYVQQGAAGNWTWTGNFQTMASLRAGAWNAIAVQVPANAAALSSLGVQFGTNGSYSGTFYIDNITF
jgi:hypothetical protein